MKVKWNLCELEYISIRHKNLSKWIKEELKKMNMIDLILHRKKGKCLKRCLIKLEEPTPSLVLLGSVEREILNYYNDVDFLTNEVEIPAILYLRLLELEKYFAHMKLKTINVNRHGMSASRFGGGWSYITDYNLIFSRGNNIEERIDIAYPAIQFHQTQGESCIEITEIGIDLYLPSSFFEVKSTLKEK